METTLSEPLHLKYKVNFSLEPRFSALPNIWLILKETFRYAKHMIIFNL